MLFFLWVLLQDHNFWMRNVHSVSVRDCISFFSYFVLLLMLSCTCLINVCQLLFLVMWPSSDKNDEFQWQKNKKGQ